MDWLFWILVTLILLLFQDIYIYNYPKQLHTFICCVLKNDFIRSIFWHYMHLHSSDFSFASMDSNMMMEILTRCCWIDTFDQFKSICKHLRIKFYSTSLMKNEHYFGLFHSRHEILQTYLQINVDGWQW